MHIQRFIITAAALTAVFFTYARQKATLPYRDAKLPVEQRVKDLLGRMTLQEKIGQLRCTLAWGYYDVIGRKKVVPSEAFKKDIADGNIGMLWATYRADPWTRKTLDNGLNPRLAALCATRCRNTSSRTLASAFRSSLPRKRHTATWR